MGNIQKRNVSIGTVTPLLPVPEKQIACFGLCFLWLNTQCHQLLMQPSQTQKRSLSLSLSRTRKEKSSINQHCSKKVKHESAAQPQTQTNQIALKPPTVDTFPLKESKDNQHEVTPAALATESNQSFNKQQCPSSPLPCAIEQDPSKLSSITSPPHSSSKSCGLDDYQCPICQADLSDLKSSFFRQKHVDQCLERSASNDSTDTAGSEFDYCIFCGKDITKLAGQRKDNHVNRCLDELSMEEQVTSFAGQSIPFLSQLEICPSCHETKPFVNRALHQKITHLKQCITKRNMSIQQLLHKIQWIQHGYTPKRRQPAPSPLPSTPPTRPTMMRIPTTVTERDDQDFSTAVLLQRIPQASIKTKDVMDDDLRLALALSRSCAESERSKIKAKGNLDYANILTVEESRKLVQEALRHLLNTKEPGLSNNPLSLPPSRLCPSTETRISFWNLAALGTNTDQSDLFSSRFIQERERNTREA